MDRVTVAIAIGSNLGDRKSHIRFAQERLSTLLQNLRVSDSHETEPVDSPAPQPKFLNAAAVGETARSAHDLLSALLALERERGRERPFSNAARTLDLDVILYGDDVIDDERLIVPHPRFRERRFVLAPLAEIAPDLRDPVTGKTIGELLAELE